MCTALGSLLQLCSPLSVYHHSWPIKPAWVRYLPPVLFCVTAANLGDAPSTLLLLSSYFIYCFFMSASWLQACCVEEFIASITDFLTELFFFFLSLYPVCTLTSQWYTEYWRAQTWFPWGPHWPSHCGTDPVLFSSSSSSFSSSLMLVLLPASRTT